MAHPTLARGSAQKWPRGFAVERRGIAIAELKYQPTSFEIVKQEYNIHRSAMHCRNSLFWQ
jgi:hypothetical protein